MSHRVLSLVAAIVLVCGCKADKCKDRPAEVEIRVVPEGGLAAKVQGTKVTLNINGGAAVLTHDFPNVSDPQFVFELGEHDQPPRTLVVQVAAYDGSGHTIGTGQEALTFSSDGCNFVTVSVTPGAPSDAGGDLPPGDGPVQVGDLDAGPTDGPPPDSWPPPDTAVDAGAPDTTPPDSGTDLPPGDGPVQDGNLDAGPDAAVDAGMDAGPDFGADAAGPDIAVDAAGPCPGVSNAAAYSEALYLNGTPRVVGGYAITMTGTYGANGSGYYGIVVDVACASNGSAVATAVHLSKGGPTVELDVPSDGKRIKLLNINNNPTTASMTVIVEDLPPP